MNQNVFSGTIRLRDQFSRGVRGIGAALRALTFPLRMSFRGFMALGRAITYGQSVLRTFRRTLDWVVTPLRKVAAGLQRLSGLARRAWFAVKILGSAMTASFTAAVGAATMMGIRFNAAIESTTMAFKQFLGSGRAAQRLMRQLVALSKVGPFELTDFTEAAQRFLAFGMKQNQVVRTLRVMQDAVAAVGGSGEHIQRVTLAFGQMLATGKVMGEELRQLMEAGIPASKILKKELGLTSDQIARIGEEGIPANRAITALVKGMERLYGGMSAVQAKTLLGQWSTLKDNVRQLTGAMTGELSRALQSRVMPALNRMTETMQGIFEGKGTFRSKLSKAWSFLTKSFDDWWRGGGKDEFSRTLRSMGEGLAAASNAVFGVGGGGQGQGIFWDLGTTAIKSFFGGMLSELKVGGILSSKLGLALQSILLVKWGPKLAVGLGKIILGGVILRMGRRAWGNVTGVGSRVGAAAGKAAGMLGLTPLTAMWVRVANWGEVALGAVPGIGGRRGGLRGILKSLATRRAAAGAAAATTDLGAIMAASAGGNAFANVAGTAAAGSKIGGIMSRLRGVATAGLTRGGLMFGKIALKSFLPGAALFGTIAGGMLFQKLADKGWLGPLNRLFPSKTDQERAARRTTNRRLTQFRRGEVDPSIAWQYGGRMDDLKRVREAVRTGLATDVYGTSPKSLQKLSGVILEQFKGGLPRAVAIDQIMAELVQRELAGKLKGGTSQKVLLGMYGGDVDKIPFGIRRRLRNVNRQHALERRATRAARRERALERRLAERGIPGGYPSGALGRGDYSAERLRQGWGPRVLPHELRAGAVPGKQQKALSREALIKAENQRIISVLTGHAKRQSQVVKASGVSAAKAYAEGARSELSGVRAAGAELPGALAAGAAASAQSNDFTRALNLALPSPTVDGPKGDFGIGKLYKLGAAHAKKLKNAYGPLGIGPGTPTSGPGGEGGNWGGSQPLIDALVALSGLRPSSLKRATKHTASGGISDHWIGNTRAYAADLPITPPAGDPIAQRLAAALGVPGYTGGSWLNVNRGGYRFQLGWKTPGHFDHIHVGARKLHGGGIFRAASPGGEGVAILRDRERIIPASGAGRPGPQHVNVSVSGNTFVVRQESDIKGIARQLASEIQTMLPNVAVQGG